MKRAEIHRAGGAVMRRNGARTRRGGQRQNDDHEDSRSKGPNPLDVAAPALIGDRPRRSL